MQTPHRVAPALMTKAARFLREQGFRRAAVRGYRILRPERGRCLPLIRQRLFGCRALELGGPTSLFQRNGLLAAYRWLRALDNVNFSTCTVWEGDLSDRSVFVIDRGRLRGTQFICEASALAGLGDGAYDAVLSSHVLEHLANPLGALREWRRVLRPGGTMLIVMPHRDGTFDHRRPVTPLAHLIADDKAGTGEDDLTHVPEILALHDLSRDPGADPATFEARCRANVHNRCLHHHVFDTCAVVAMLDRAGLQILHVEARRPYHICLLATKPVDHIAPENRHWMGAAAPYRARSSFPSDRI